MVNTFLSEYYLFYGQTDLSLKKSKSVAEKDKTFYDTIIKYLHDVAKTLGTQLRDCTTSHPTSRLSVDCCYKVGR